MSRTSSSSSPLCSQRTSRKLDFVSSRRPTLCGGQDSLCGINAPPPTASPWLTQHSTPHHIRTRPNTRTAGQPRPNLAPGRLFQRVSRLSSLRLCPWAVTPVGRVSTKLSGPDGLVGAVVEVSSPGRLAGGLPDLRDTQANALKRALWPLPTLHEASMGE